MKYFDLSIPLNIPGNDMEIELMENGGNIPEAFKVQAGRHEKAASIYRRMASVAVETPSLKVDCLDNVIGIDGPKDLMEALEKDGVVVSVDIDEDDFSDLEEDLTHEFDFDIY